MRAAAAATVRLGIVLASIAPLGGCRRVSPPPPSTPTEPTWQLVASELPGALLSVDGTSAHDVYAVGADKGDGPLVLHFDGARWSTLATGVHGDLWWVHALPDGALMSGANGTILHYAARQFERLHAGGLARQTVYGVWGRSADDFYAVGSAAGRDGFVWHYAHGHFENLRLPDDRPRGVRQEAPGFFKVWGHGDDVWVVGSSGTILQRHGEEPFRSVASGTRETLFTIHGVAGRVVAVGGGSNGVAQTSSGKAFASLLPPSSPLVQGIFTGEANGEPFDWASGERGALYARQGPGLFQPVEHELPLPPKTSLHAIWVDAEHGVWSVGGDVLTPALDSGVMVHFGAPVPPVPRPGAIASTSTKATCSDEVVQAGRERSIARRWDEQALAAIRLDLPRPTVHARNLFHLSAAMWDAWAAYDRDASGVFVREKLEPQDREAERRAAISFAAYRLLTSRYEHAIGGGVTAACLRAVMTDLGYDADDRHEQGHDPIALGNRIAAEIARATLDDGALQASDYADPAPFLSPNPPLAYDAAGADLVDPNVWQPLNLSVAATQNGIILPAGVQTYIGSRWGKVTPFALTRRASTAPWLDPGPSPKVGPDLRHWLVDVIEKTAAVDPHDGRTIDISPAAMGHNSLGANDGRGYAKNPVTGEPYPREVVPRADFARVMAEFWADGPKSETPPGHWNLFANLVADSPLATHRLFGSGPVLDPLAWDVHVYLALNGALHDAAIAAWDIKRRTVTARPISLIRWMGAKGQSSDPQGPAYAPDGLPLVSGLVEVVTRESSAPGARHEALASYVGQVAVRGWPGEPGDRLTESSGTHWLRAVDWVPYQRRTFVTPAFPGFISGHSTFSRAGAEVLAELTGSPYFPGGYAEVVLPAGTFLTFEQGPTRELRLGWAAFTDASDEAGQSRIWGGIHLEPDDLRGRRIGDRVGRQAVAKVRGYFKAGPGRSP